MSGLGVARNAIIATVFAVAASCSSSASAQVELVAPAARAGARELIEALKGFAVRAPTTRLVDGLSEAGGGAAVEALSARVMNEGGEAALKQAARLVEQVGPAAISALSKTARPAAVLEALDGLPADMAKKAVNALGRGVEGQATAEAIGRFGSGALKVELQHPGVGTKIAQDLGESGIKIAERLPTADAILLARRSEQIAQLPAAQKQAILEAATRRLGDFITFLEKNPKFIFTAATTAVLLKEGDQIFGNSQVTTDANGNPVALASPGFIERFLQTFLAGIAASILAPLGMALALVTAGWGAIKLWFLYRRHRARERRV